MSPLNYPSSLSRALRAVSSTCKHLRRHLSQFASSLAAYLTAASRSFCLTRPLSYASLNPTSSLSPKEPSAVQMSPVTVPCCLPDAPTSVSGMPTVCVANKESASVSLVNLTHKQVDVQSIHCPVPALCWLQPSICGLLLFLTPFCNKMLLLHLFSAQRRVIAYLTLCLLIKFADLVCK